jgi:hypothetical protein
VVVLLGEGQATPLLLCKRVLNEPLAAQDVLQIRAPRGNGEPWHTSL